jgi:hypothetical protein
LFRHQLSLLPLVSTLLMFYNFVTG